MKTRELPILLEGPVNEAIRHAATLPWQDALPNGYAEHPSPNKWDGRNGSRVRCVVWHITEGSGESALDWLTAPASEVSAHDLVMEDGELVNLVPGDDTAWANGPVNAPRIDFKIVLQTVATGTNPNRVSYSIESAGRSSYGRGGSLSPRQQATLIVRTAQVCMRYMLTADGEHILRHAYWDSVNRPNCPGYSRQEMLDWIEAVSWLTNQWRGW